jgi:hypothetical protein
VYQDWCGTVFDRTESDDNAAAHAPTLPQRGHLRVPEMRDTDCEGELMLDIYQTIGLAYTIFSVAATSAAIIVLDVIGARYLLHQWRTGKELNYSDWSWGRLERMRAVKDRQDLEEVVEHK